MSSSDSACRLCGISEGIKFKIFDAERDYVSKIRELLPIMVHEKDPWSKLICHRCAFKLQEFHNFRESCIRTDMKLKTQVAWEPQRQSTPLTSQHAPVEPTNLRIRKEVSDCQLSNPPALKPEPPPLPPVPVLRSVQPVLSTQPPPQLPEVKFSQNTLANSLVSNNLYTKEHADNLPRTSVLTQAPAPASAPPTDTVFLNSEHGEYFLPEEPEAADSDSNVDDQDAGSNAKDAVQKTKVNHKPGPKSRVGRKGDNFDNDDSDIEIVLHKPSGSLDIIDMTDDIDSPVEDVDEGDPSEGLLPHVILTRIPGMCNIYTCCLCEGTFTSKGCANNHVCKNR